MGCLLFALFALVPAAEIWLLIRVGGSVGFLPTLGGVLLGAALGSWLLRREGNAAMARAQRQMAQGQLPTDEIRHGLAISAAAILLLTPGFLTDIVALGLLFPPTRALILAVVRAWWRRMAPGGFVQVFMEGRGATAPPPPPRAGAPPFRATRDDEDVIDLPPDQFEVR